MWWASSYTLWYMYAVASSYTLSTSFTCCCCHCTGKSPHHPHHLVPPPAPPFYIIIQSTFYTCVAENVNVCNFGILHVWHIQIFRYCHFELLKFGDIAILRYIEIFGYCNYEILKFWGIAVLRYCYFELLKFWDIAILRYCNFEILHGALIDCTGILVSSPLACTFKSPSTLSGWSTAVTNLTIITIQSNWLNWKIPTTEISCNIRSSCQNIQGKPPQTKFGV